MPLHILDLSHLNPHREIQVSDRATTLNLSIGNIIFHILTFRFSSLLAEYVVSECGGMKAKATMYNKGILSFTRSAASGGGSYSSEFTSGEGSRHPLSYLRRSHPNPAGREDSGRLRGLCFPIQHRERHREEGAGAANVWPEQ